MRVCGEQREEDEWNRQDRPSGECRPARCASRHPRDYTATEALRALDLAESASFKARQLSRSVSWSVTGSRATAWTRSMFSIERAASSANGSKWSRSRSTSSGSLLRFGLRAATQAEMATPSLRVAATSRRSGVAAWSTRAPHGRRRREEEQRETTANTHVGPVSARRGCFLTPRVLPTALRRRPATWNAKR